MALENIKRKLESDKKAKRYTETTVIITPDGKVQRITKRVSFAELLEDYSGYEHNDEDPDFEKEMEGED